MSMPMEARVAYVLSQVASMNAELAGMQLQNLHDAEGGRPMTYKPHDFMRLPQQFELGCNTVIKYLRDGK